MCGYSSMSFQYKRLKKRKIYNTRTGNFIIVLHFLHHANIFYFIRENDAVRIPKINHQKAFNPQKNPASRGKNVTINSTIY